MSGELKVSELPVVPNGTVFDGTETVVFNKNGSTFRGLIADLLGWKAPNPMTAAGDLIVGGASGAQTRLPIGAQGRVLTVNGGAPVWQQLPGALSFSWNRVTTGFLGAYTLQLSDANNGVMWRGGANVNIIIPPNSSVAFPIDTKIKLLNMTTFNMTNIPESGVTRDYGPGIANPLPQFGMGTLWKIDTDYWIYVNG